MFTPDVLVRRAAIVKAIRAYFDDLGFVEVETAVRIAAPAPEPHIDCPVVVGPSTSNLQSSTSYLRASPELQMKKLLAAGMDRIYQIGPCFREGECGRRHNPEFTMIEWYRRNASYLDIKADLECLLSRLFAAPPLHLSTTPPLHLSTLSVREAYLRFVGWDPWTDWDQDRFDFDMATKIEPALKTMGGVFLMDYPPQAASLAKLSSGGPRSVAAAGGPRSVAAAGGPRSVAAAGCPAVAPCLSVAERWEFYWNGLELANCFTELCDADEQRRRFEAARAERRALGESDYPMDDRFLETLPAIGSAAGVALGVDRLVMVLTGADDISSVRAPE